LGLIGRTSPGGRGREPIAEQPPLDAHERALPQTMLVERNPGGRRHQVSKPFGRQMDSAGELGEREIRYSLTTATFPPMPSTCPN